MAMKVKVKVENLDRTIEAEVGQNLRDALLDNDLSPYSRYFGLPKWIWDAANCRGHGTCGTCQLAVVEGAEKLSDPSIYEKCRLKLQGRKNVPDRRLSCMARIYDDCTVRTLETPPEFE